MTRKNNKSVLLSVRIPIPLNEAIKANLEATGQSKSALIVNALAKELKVNPDGSKRTGRPRTGRTTKVIRVPKDLPDNQALTDIVEVLREWSDQSNQASQTSPRWEKLRQLLSEVDGLLDSN